MKVTFRLLLKEYEAILNTGGREALDAPHRFYHLLRKHETEGLTEEERQEALRLIYRLDRD